MQSDQYPRALDLARPLRAAGIPASIGGFHVSGCLAMLGVKAVPDACREMGMLMFAGEVEGRLDTLRGVGEGRLQPVYNFMKDLPSIEGAPVPVLPIAKNRRTLGLSSSFDSQDAGTPTSAALAIINVQGRKSRYRSADDIEALVRVN